MFINVVSYKFSTTFKLIKQYKEQYLNLLDFDGLIAHGIGWEVVGEVALVRTRIEHSPRSTCKFITGSP